MDSSPSDELERLVSLPRKCSRSHLRSILAPAFVLFPAVLPKLSFPSVGEWERVEE